MSSRDSRSLHDVALLLLMVLAAISTGIFLELRRVSDLAPHEVVGISIGLVGGSIALLATVWKIIAWLRSGRKGFWPWKVTLFACEPIKSPTAISTFSAGIHDFWLRVTPRRYVDIQVVGVRFQKRWKIPFTNGNVSRNVIEVVNLRDASLTLEPQPHHIRTSSPTPDYVGGMRLRYNDGQRGG